MGLHASSQAQERSASTSAHRSTKRFQYVRNARISVRSRSVRSPASRKGTTNLTMCGIQMGARATSSAATRTKIQGDDETWTGSMSVRASRSLAVGRQYQRRGDRGSGSWPRDADEVPGVQSRASHLQATNRIAAAVAGAEFPMSLDLG